MADMLIAGDKPVFIADASSSDDLATRLAKFSPVAHYLGHPESEEQALGVALAILEHGAGQRFCMGFIAALERCLRLSGSPAEARLAVHLCQALELDALVTAQAPVAAGGKDYRADFMVEAPELGFRLVVEVDGHDFHERTKEQAARDRSRDRSMLAEGYRVMRFTGSEVWKNPTKCAAEVRAYLQGHQ